MPLSRQQQIDDYLQRESIVLTKSFGNNAFLNNLSYLDKTQKEKLYNIIEELKQKGSAFFTELCI
jgi:hypothetical protein